MHNNVCQCIYMNVSIYNYLESNEGLLELAVQSALVLGSVGGGAVLQKSQKTEQNLEQTEKKKKREKKRNE